MENKNSRAITFRFHPNDFENKGHLVIKADPETKQKRRYVCGVSSGPNVDGHSERMTEKCIKSFMSQANSGDILLYPDVHGIRESEDIGILTTAKVLSDGNWFTEYRLYDELDKVGSNKLEKVNDIWRQISGESPYRKPRQKGFSIEGFIPEGAILSGEVDSLGNVKKRVIDNVLLDGVVLVSRPAYQDSIASAIYKALGEVPPWTSDDIRKSVRGELANKLREEKLRDSYYREKWDVMDALEKTIEKIMKKDNSNKAEELNVAFDEFKNIMINILLQSQDLFIEDESDSENEDDIPPYSGETLARSSKLDVLKGLLFSLKKLKKSFSE